MRQKHSSLHIWTARYLSVLKWFEAMRDKSVLSTYQYSSQSSSQKILVLDFYRMCTLPKPSAAFFLTVSSLVIVRMHLASCLSVLKQVGKHDMIRCLLWLRCCNKIISSCSRQTMEALTNMWIHATNKGSPLDVMMVRFYLFKHFMDLYLSIVEVFKLLKL